MMRKRKRKLTIWVAMLVLMMNSSCVYESRNDVEPSCNTEEVTYMLTIETILEGNCTGCHSSANPAGGLNFDSYAGTLPAAIDGRLLGSIKHLDGFEPMPRFAPKLPDCEISKIEKWVNDGAPDN